MTGSLELQNPAKTARLVRDAGISQLIYENRNKTNALRARQKLSLEGSFAMTVSYLMSPNGDCQPDTCIYQTHFSQMQPASTEKENV